MFGQVHLEVLLFSGKVCKVWVKRYDTDFDLSKTGEVLAYEQFENLKVSNVFLGPDGYVYLTGDGGVYRKKRKQ